MYGSFPPWGKSVEFPASGGGGNYVYFDSSHMTATDVEMSAIGENSLFVKEIGEFGDTVITTSRMAMLSTPPLAFAVDMNMRVSNYEDSDTLVLMTMKDLLVKYYPSILDLPRLTEEEFYKIAPTFAILHHGGGENITIHEYEEGMTWGEWVNSDYNTINALISDNNQVQILIPNNDWNATLGSKIDGWLYSDNIIKSEQYDAYY